MVRFHSCYAGRFTTHNCSCVHASFCPNRRFLSWRIKTARISQLLHKLYSQTVSQKESLYSVLSYMVELCPVQLFSPSSVLFPANCALLVARFQCFFLWCVSMCPSVCPLCLSRPIFNTDFICLKGKALFLVLSLYRLFCHPKVHGLHTLGPKCKKADLML